MFVVYNFRTHAHQKWTRQNCVITNRHFSQIYKIAEILKNLGFGLMNNTFCDLL
uniref:Uncharacterized protein n=1 Tax=Arundo donax TaxID=35708 RepID=A0A0A9GEZ0_ARUDO